MKCDFCGKEFKAGNDQDGVPYGMRFELPNGRTFEICSDCISLISVLPQDEFNSQMNDMFERQHNDKRRVY